MLEARFNTHLKNFHLQIELKAEAGQTTVLLGESGAGKTTVLRLLAGLTKAEQGLIALDEDCYFDSERQIYVPPQERPFGYVFQDYVLFPHMSVFENVAFGLRAQGLPVRVVRARVGGVLEQMRLQGYEQRKPGQLSGGQQQRVAIARALVLQPRLLLLDEPLSALDVQTRREVRHELRQLLKQLNITTILVTHNYLEALLFGQQILVLDQGHVIQQGTQRELLERPRSSYIAELVGMNLFRGQVVRREADSTCVVRLTQSSHELEISALQQEGAEDAPLNGDEAFVVVDPRSITLSLERPAGSARNVFAGEIMQILRLDFPASEGEQISSGGQVRVSVLLDPQQPPLSAEITRVSAQRLDLHEGQQVFASFKATMARAYS